MDYQLELIDVAKQYKEFLAVDSVNLQIEKGEIVSFLGASGCGKTTTLRMIAGLIEPTRGTIRIQGRDMNGIPPHKRISPWYSKTMRCFPISVYMKTLFTD
jgi:ABC-type Fe3+/spermidine/putrescine transport system ATPase subunit